MITQTKYESGIELPSINEVHCLDDKWQLLTEIGSNYATGLLEEEVQQSR